MDTETNKRPVRKVAAIIGFIAVLVLIAVLSITLVRNVPGSFASLASLAESVRSFDATQLDHASDDEATPSTSGAQDMLIVTSDTNVIESDDNVRLSWTDASVQGSFVFSYECTDGVALTIVENSGVRDLICDTNYNLGNVNNLTLRITSEKERFVDINYTLGFIASTQTEPSATADAVITVVNDEVPLTFTSTNSEATEEEMVAEEEIVASVSETPVTSEPETPTTAVAEPVNERVTEVFGQEFTQEFTYTIPVSDPNGRTDLATRFLDTGRISNNTFLPGLIESDETGAIQFEVKNLGSKTSGEWTYSVSLPTGGMVNSSEQAPLKPNERAVITIGFPAANQSSYDVVVSVNTTGDSTSINNRFVKTVLFE